MLTRAYITDIDYDNSKLRIRMPTLDKIDKDKGSTPDDQLSWASYLEIPGISVAYEIGDVVLVGFEDNDIKNPIVLGHVKLSNSERNKAPRVVENILSTKVQQDAQLPTNTKFMNYAQGICVATVDSFISKSVEES